MAKPWAGITAGLLAGAAGATAKNAVSYVDHAVAGSPPATSPSASTVADTAAGATGAASKQADTDRSDALGPLGGLAIGAGVGALAGVIRGTNFTPPPAVAAALTGLVAMAVGSGLAGATGSKAIASPSNLGRDLISHLAYGAVTSYALHRMLDPHTATTSRLRSLTG